MNDLDLRFFRKTKLKKAKKILKKIKNGDTSLEHKYKYGEKLEKLVKKTYQRMFLVHFYKTWDENIL